MKRQVSLVSSMGSQALAAGLAAALSFAAQASPAIKAGQLGSAHLQLSDSYNLGFSAPKSAGAARALSMGSADFDNDGFPDLISAYASDKGGLISLHRGNEQAWAPSSPASQALVRSGVFPPGFNNTPTLLSVAVAPELLALGDFDRDGNVDLAIAKRGDSTLYFLPGTGSGGFAAARTIELGAGIDAIAAGQIDLPDGMADLAVAVSNAAGASLLSYSDRSDGIKAKPERTALSAAADALAIGNLDSSPMGDVAILSNGALSILHGRNPRLPAPGFNRLEALKFDFAIQAFALGNFVWDRAGNTELALLKDDGSVQIAARGTLDTRAYSVEEVRALRLSQHRAKSTNIKYWQPGSEQAWRIAESTAPQMSKSSAQQMPLLLSAYLAGQSSADLLVIDTLAQTIKVLTVEGNTRKSYAIVASSAPMAVLSLQTSAFVRPSLIVLGAGAAPPSIAPSVAKATFVVSKTADTLDGTCNADCSLREAITAANLAAGADSITLPAGTYDLTRLNALNDNEDANATGDLDVTGELTINGAGSATTIVRAGTDTSNGIDKVFAFSPFCAALNTGINGVTVRFGRNTQPFDRTPTSDFGDTGGGVDVCNAGAGGFTATNVVLDQNTNTNSYGGGINLDSITGSNGTYTLTNVAVTGNRTTSVSAIGLKQGGGLNLYASAHNVSITNSTITGNSSTTEGGGVFASHTNGGAVTISGTTIGSNTSGSRGGGISSLQLGTASLTINNDSAILGNTSQGTLTGTESRGGGVHVLTQPTTTATIREATITGNFANTGSLQAGGGIAVTGSGEASVTFSRIAGNTAGIGGGSGLHSELTLITVPVSTIATRNWWGCNAGPTAAPCDRSTNVSGTLTTAPHLVLRHAASPATIFVTQTSTLTADFLRDSANGVIAVSDLDALIGTSKVFNGAVLGGLSAAQTSIQANGTATATFTATGAGAGSANSVVDAHTQTAAITINRFDSLTTITSDLPDPSLAGAAVPVNFTVAPVAPGVVAPTGNVVVTISGGGETCSGTVAAGSCLITLTGTGNRILTANYTGDTLYNPDSDTETHQVLAPPALSINDATVTEGNGGTVNATFTVSLTSAPVVSAVSFDIATAVGTAASPGDFVAQTLTGQTIPIGISTYTFTVAVNGDALVEPNETFFVNVSNVTNATVTDGQGQGTITNDDVPSASIAVSPPSVLEDGAGNLTYTVTLDQAPIVATTVNLATTGTATSGFDYTGGVLSVAFSIGATTRTIVIDPTADATTESNETVIITVTSGTGYTVGTPSSATGTITDDDLPTPPTITDIANQTVNEDVATSALAFTVGDTQTPAASLVVTGSSSNLTLVPNANIVFGGSGASRTVTVTPAANLSGSSTITVTVTDGGGLTATDTFLLTVNPVNDAPSFVVGPSQNLSLVNLNAQSVPNWATAISDGDPDVVQTLTFNVTNSNNALFSVQPSVASDGTLSYTPSGLLGNNVLVTVSLTDDATAGGAALTTAVQQFTITITSPAPSLTYEPPQLPNQLANTEQLRTVFFFNGISGAGQTRNGLVQITPSGGGVSTANTTTVNSCAITGPDASSFSDVSGVNLSFIGNTAPAQTVPLTCTSGSANRSAVLNCTETRGVVPAVTRSWPVSCPTCNLQFSSTLDAVPPTLPPGTVGVDAITGTQTGRMNRFATVSTCAVPTTNPGSFTNTGARRFDRYRITPARSGCVNVQLVSGASTAFFHYAVSSFDPANPTANYIADPGSTFPNQGSFQLTATAGTPFDVVVHEVNPGVADLPYTLNLDACTVEPNASPTISDVANQTVNEDTATSALPFTVGDTETPAASLTVSGSSSNTALVPNGNIVFVGSGANRTVTVTPAPNVSGSSTITLTVTDGGGATATDTFVLTVNPINDLPSFTAGPNQSLAPGTSTAQTVANWATAISDGDPDFVQALSFNVSNNNNLLFTAQPTVAANGTLSFTPTGLSGSSLVSVSLTDDNTAGGAALTTAVQTFTISVAAGSTSISIDDVPVTEGNAGNANAVFTVTRGNRLTSFTVPYSVVAVSAQAGSDYVATSGTLTFTEGPAAALSQTISVPVIGDLVVEGTETATLTLGAITNVTGTTTISDGSGLLTINDNDSATVSFNPSSVSQSEATSPMPFTVTLSNPVASGVTVNVNSTNGTADAADFTAISGTVSFPPNSTAAQTVNVVINSDAIDENDEQFTLTLSNLIATGSVALGTTIATGTIQDDDAAPTLAINDVSIVEGNSGTSNLVFTVTRTGLTALPVSFTAATADGTATATSDYVAVLAGSTTIAAGGATGTTTLTATINGDAVTEANETFFINLTAPVNATIDDAQGIGTITNDDTPGVTVVQSGGNTAVREGGATDSYTLVLTSQPTSDVSIALNPGTQLTAVTSPVVFNSGNWTVPQTVTVTAVDDAVAEGAHTGTITHAVTSSDPNYNNLTVANVVASITDNDLTITPTTLPNGRAAVSYSQAFSTAPGATPYSYAVTAGALPAGLTLSTAGTLSGTPTAVGSFNFTVTSTDSGSSTGTRVYTLVIDPPLITISPTTLPNPLNNVAYSQQLTASGGNPAYAFNISAGALPSGINISPTGLISGTTTASGIVNFTVRACDTTTGPNTPYCGTQAYTLILNTPPVANPNSYTVLEDQVLTIAAPGVLENDTDIDPGTTLTVNPAVSAPITLVSGNVAGTVAISANGALSYTPSANTNGSGTASYFAFDGNVPSVTAGLVTITVTPVNDAPSFTTLGDRAEVAGASGNRTVNGFVNNVSFGPSNESSQTVSAYLVSEDSDPANIVSNVAISTSGVLTYTLADVPTGGTATIRAQLRDSGGTANGGVDLSAPQTFRITLQGGSDLGVVLYNGRDLHNGGGLVNYVIVVRNAGPIAINGARVLTTLASQITPSAWTCSASGGASCTTSGSGSIDQLVNLPVEGVVRFDLTSSLITLPEGGFSSSVSVTAPAPLGDRNPADNSATDNDRIGIFANGFEQPIFVEGIDGAPEEVSLNSPANGKTTRIVKLPSVTGDAMLPSKVLRVIDSQNNTEGLIEMRQNNGQIELRASLKQGEQWTIGNWKANAKLAQWDVAQGKLVGINVE